VALAPPPPVNLGALLDPQHADDEPRTPTVPPPRKPAPTANGSAAPSPSIIVDPALAKPAAPMPEIPIDLGPDGPARPPTAVIPRRNSKNVPLPAVAPGKPRALLAAAAVAIALLAFGAGWMAKPNAQRKTEVVRIVVPQPVASEQKAQPAEPPVEQQGFAVGSLRFEPLPPGTKVTIDADLLGHTDGDHFLAPGAHMVSIQVPGFFPFDEQVELIAGQTKTLAPKLEKLPASKGIVEVVCTPWCEIAVDGKPSGYSPAKLSLTVGMHKLRAGSPQLGVAKELEVHVDANSTQKLEVKLAN
jgi:hypothetical protein